MVQDGLKILAVDDCPLMTELFLDYLSCDGHTVLVASNGKEAMKIIENVPDLDLIISDYDMPEMNGVELLREMRSRNFICPFILSTSHVEVFKQVMDLNVYAFLPKPYKMEVLGSHINRLIKIKENLRKKNSI